MMIFGFKVPTLTLAKKTQPKPPNAAASKKRAIYVVKEQPKRQVSYEIKDIYSALYMANKPQDPDRTRILSIYEYILNDGHLSSQIEQARMKVLSEPFSLFKDKKPDEETTKILQSAWFENILIGILDAEFYGFTLLDAFPLEEKLDVVMIPRANVAPDERLLLIDGTPNGATLAYGGLEEKLHLVQFGKSKDMGTLLKAAFNVIFKYYARSDWSRASEKFGMPILHIKTDTNQETELDRLELKAAAFGSDGYIVTQAGDEATIVERKGQDLHKIYLDNINYCDEQISKIINGQTGTSDEKAFAGSAQVHERVQNTFTISRMRRIKYEVNDVVIPYLVNLGLISDGLEFDFITFRNEQQSGGKPPSNLDTKVKPQPQSGKTQLSKKKLRSFPGLTLSDQSFKLLNTLFKQLHLSRMAGAADKLIEEIYNQHKASADSSKPLFSETYSRLRDGVDEGSSRKWVETEYRSTSWEMQKNLRYNVGVFSAFKNHAQVDEMVSALRDEKGALRSYNDFKKTATGIEKDYNENWLKAEYNAAVRSARTATDWVSATTNQKLYPNIEYLPSRSAHRRVEHEQYYGIIRPVDDPFWNTHLPPVGWGCKCGWRTTRSTSTEVPENLPPVPKAFAHNPGKSQQVFSPDHPFMKDRKSQAKEIEKEARSGIRSTETKAVLEYAKSSGLTSRSYTVDGIDEPVKFVRNSFTENMAIGALFFDKLYCLYNINEILQSSKGKASFEPNHDKKRKPGVEGYYKVQTQLNGKSLELLFEKRTNKVRPQVTFHFIKILK